MDISILKTATKKRRGYREWRIKSVPLYPDICVRVGYDILKPSNTSQVFMYYLHRFSGGSGGYEIPQRKEDAKVVARNLLRGINSHNRGERR